MSTSEILVRVLPTPNPNALKFIVNRPIKSSGKATFTRPSEAGDLRLANDLFAIDGVRQLHLFENVVTVTHSEEVDPNQLADDVRAVLQVRLPIHDPNFIVEEERKAIDRSNLSPELQQIEAILDRTVRSYLQGDGGDIDVLELSGKTLYVRYQGACGTCPSSIAGTLEAIKGILRDEFDPELEIEAV